VRPEAVIEERDVDFSIYEVPTNLVDAGLDQLISERLALPRVERTNLDDWRSMLADIKATRETCQIALVGKYIELHDAYKSIYEAFSHAGIANHCKVEVRKVRAEDVLAQGPSLLEGVHGILVPGGFGERGIEGKIQAAKIARERGIPYFGICLGMQIAVVEFARSVAGLEGANSSEFDPETPFPVVDLLPEQKEVSDMGGTMRLGADPVKLHEGTKAREIFGEAVIYKRHRHRYEVNNQLRRRLEDEGLVCGGTSPDERLVEMVELPDHPFYVASQYHPEFNSRPNRPEPLFREFVGAAAKHAGEKPAASVESDSAPAAETDDVGASHSG
jgi:CTP synthase